MNQEDDDNFGDFGDFEEPPAVTQTEAIQEANIFDYKPEQPSEVKEFEETTQENQNLEFGDFEEASIHEDEFIVAPKPKIELNENNLLGGFMAEFGTKKTQGDQSSRGDAKSACDEEQAEESFTTRQSELEAQIHKIFENTPDYAKIGTEILKKLNKKEFFENQENLIDSEQNLSYFVSIGQGQNLK